MFEDKLKKIKHNKNALTILLFISERGPKTARQLSRFFELDISVVFVALDDLTKTKLISKTGDRPAKYYSTI